MVAHPWLSKFRRVEIGGRRNPSLILLCRRPLGNRTQLHLRRIIELKENEGHLLYEVTASRANVSASYALCVRA